MKFSIVTPSFNQSEFLEQTIQSVLFSASVGCVDLEYIVIDGGSTDESSKILEKYRDHFSYCVSEKDAGQYDAINKGFARSSGEIMAWINSSDFYLPWTLATVKSIFERFPEVEWVTSLQKLCLEETGEFDGLQRVPGFAGRLFYAGLHGGRGNLDFIQQEAVFWRRSLWEKAGGAIPTDCPHAADFHLWGEFFKHAPVYCLDAPMAAFRSHENSKSEKQEYLSEVNHLLEKWSAEGLETSSTSGFGSIIRQWTQGKREWRFYWHAGHEFLLVKKFLGNAPAEFLDLLIWKICRLYFMILNPLTYAARFVAWPFRRRPPWKS